MRSKDGANTVIGRLKSLYFIKKTKYPRGHLRKFNLISVLVD